MWGPWIEHDGKGCPVQGMLVETHLRNGKVRQSIAGAECFKSGLSPNSPLSAWVWDEGKTAYRWPDGEVGRVNTNWQIIRYRIKHPRGLEILEGILAEIDAPVREVTS